MRASIQSDNPASLPDGIAPSVPLQYFSQLQRQMTRANYEPLYDDVKTLLCCTLADGVQKAWIAYTVASTFAGVPRPKVSVEMFILQLHLILPGRRGAGHHFVPGCSPSASKENKSFKWGCC